MILHKSNNCDYITRYFHGRLKRPGVQPIKVPAQNLRFKVNVNTNKSNEISSSKNKKK
jgi:hypothetical protein